MPKTLAAPLYSELVIKKSRFLGCVQPLASQDEGLQKLASLRQAYPDARHLCFCMLIQGQVRQSDDGEPSGTAALPMLRVLQHKGLDNVLATVVRYFGGVKLGAGGLVRAYSQAISEPLNTAELIDVRSMSSLHLELDYELQSQLRHHAEQAGLLIQLDYQQQLLAQLTGEPEHLEDFFTRLQEVTSGRVKRTQPW